MSRAFVKESDGAGEPLPELSVSPHPNHVTPAGLAQIEARVTALEAELRSAKAGDDQALTARIQRDLRYWAQRTFTIVGEDEADPANGLVSWVSPLGRALTGKAVGDEVTVTKRAAEIVALSY